MLSACGRHRSLRLGLRLQLKSLRLLSVQTQPKQQVGAFPQQDWHLGRDCRECDLLRIDDSKGKKNIQILSSWCFSHLVRVCAFLPLLNFRRCAGTRGISRGERPRSPCYPRRVEKSSLEKRMFRVIFLTPYPAPPAPRRRAAAHAHSVPCQGWRLRPPRRWPAPGAHAQWGAEPGERRRARNGGRGAGGAGGRLCRDAGGERGGLSAATWSLRPGFLEPVLGQSLRRRGGQRYPQPERQEAP